MKINSKLVKTLRSKRLWSQDELATACGASLRTIQRLEGEGQASAETLKALASVFEIDCDSLKLVDQQAFEEYVNIQMGYAILLLFFGVAILLTVMLSASDLTSIPFIVGIAVCALACTLFSTLTTRVTTTQISWHFTFGFLRKSLPIDQIKTCERVRNKCWWGLGIRLIPSGWLYCVSGLDAVALRLKDGRKYRIGTDEPDNLIFAIEQVKQSEVS